MYILNVYMYIICIIYIIIYQAMSPNHTQSQICTAKFINHNIYFYRNFAKVIT